MGARRRDGHDRRHGSLDVRGRDRATQPQVDERRTGASTPPTRRAGAPYDYTFTAPGVYTFLCEVHARDHDRHGHRRGRPAPTRSRTCSSSPRRPASATTRSTRASPRSRRSARPTTSRSTATEDAAAFTDRQPRAVRRRGLPLHHRRRAQRRAAGRVRGLHPGPAAASSASTRPPTPSTRGPGTARCSAATSATTRPEPPAATVDIRTPTSPPPRAFRPTGRASTSGTTSNLPTTPSSTAAATTTRRATAASRCSPRSTSRPTPRTTATTTRRRPPGRVVLGLRRRPHLVHGARPHRRSPSAPARATSARTSSAASRR